MYIYSNRQVSRSLRQQCSKNSINTLLYVLAFFPSAYSVLIKYLVKAKEDEALLHRQQSDILSSAFIVVLLEVCLKRVGLIVPIQVKLYRLRFWIHLFMKEKVSLKLMQGKFHYLVCRESMKLYTDSVSDILVNTWNKVKSNFFITAAYDLSRIGQDAIFRRRIT